MAEQTLWEPLLGRLKSALNFKDAEMKEQSQLASLLRQEPEKAAQRIEHIFRDIRWQHLEQLTDLREAMKQVARTQYNDAMFHPLLISLDADAGMTTKWHARELAEILRSEPKLASLRARFIGEHCDQGRLNKHPELLRQLTLFDAARPGEQALTGLQKQKKARRGTGRTSTRQIG